MCKQNLRKRLRMKTNINEQIGVFYRNRLRRSVLLTLLNSVWSIFRILACEVGKKEQALAYRGWDCEGLSVKMSIW